AGPCVRGRGGRAQRLQIHAETRRTGRCAPEMQSGDVDGADVSRGEIHRCEVRVRPPQNSGTVWSPQRMLTAPFSSRAKAISKLTASPCDDSGAAKHPSRKASSRGGAAWRQGWK